MSKSLDNGVTRKVLAWTVAFGLFGFAALPRRRLPTDPHRHEPEPDRSHASAGKQVLAGLEIWRDDVNAKGGLIGRPVELVYYDDQGSPANAPGIYAKLLGVDKVDLLIGPYSTNVIAAALPAIMQGNRTTIGIFGLGANEQFKYPKYFSMNSQGPSPANYSKCVFDLAAAQTPRPKRVALIGADVEYSRRALDGARENAKAMGFDIVFERTYPPSTTEFSPIVRAMQAADPDFVFAATLPVDTAGIVEAAKEIQFRPKLIGGAMLGLLITAIKQKLGPDINGYISNEFYIPAPSLQFDGTTRFLETYQKRARRARHRSARLYLSALRLRGRANSAPPRSPAPSRLMTTSSPPICASTLSTP